MHHLSPETLARAIDGPVSTEEAAHLAACERCRTERTALHAQRAELAALPDPPAPPGVWAGVEARLRADGSLAGPTVVARIGGRFRRPALQAAAAVALFATGALAGVMMDAGGAPEPGPADAGAPATQPADPAAALRDAESEYLYALARWMEAGGTLPAEDPVGRLAALESILYTTRAALERAPEDPVLEGFYRTAWTQRQAMMTQVDMTMEQEEWY